jgi:hypothetical protein
MPDDPTSTAQRSGGAPLHGEVRHVPASGVAVFAGPDRADGPIAQLAAGTEVIVVGRRPPWVHLHGPDELDGWADGTELAGVAKGAAASPAPVVSRPAVDGQSSATPHTSVVEKQRSPLRVGTGPVVGALGGLVAVIGTKLPWVQSVGPLHEHDAFGVSWHVLNGWDQAAKPGPELGLLIVILAAIAVVVSLVAGGGIVRRILGLALMIVCVIFVLQAQDLLTNAQRGIGTGLNVWDLVDYGVLVTFAGGLVMLCAPSR